MSIQSQMLILISICSLAVVSNSFLLKTPGNVRRAQHESPPVTSRWMSDESDNKKGITGDPLRASTGIRPSLHPTTINAIAEALKTRASNSTDTPLVVEGNVQPLDVALSAGKIAATAIEKRQRASKQDGMELTPEEGQTIAGRVVGVVMRFAELEELLNEKVANVEWVKKYEEWDTFGVLEDESQVQDRIRMDPLFAMSRAECLLALFLDTVESPRMEKIGQSAPGGSGVDFLDADRQEVLLSFL
mmetsp:Transcript_11127/g.20168  ORF Transcript_11127/g.20168 Transcript_11127/m.20168 type:complete len:246 (+) Transcript_11127:279-1016(+)|eukprot:CAMPEP_0202491890 /NCGR_PEP_ID=MMETSP1361-20130828/8804_1 /ASSEMBLY_ACC=CAM_ASM_000849 /TAXON_ID=210615 /ORGANISM="Staurosira complex sp., Strain CCMP2646" /LENGTH=245 /DNA_ID=CAMNT_0049122013 /DNA_START=258 /DNA_END=995 /DNA_ORIENTATION=+